VLAVDLYNDDRISPGKAAELADVSYDEFYTILKARGHKIRHGPITLEEVDEEYTASITKEQKNYLKIRRIYP